MKIILSRKGFDSSIGGCPSPILPDGTLLSMPIPNDSDTSFRDIAWNGVNYADILNQICPNKRFNKCHVDPDIRNNRVNTIKGWMPAFGQSGSAQGILSNAGVETGDIFLFFGWFRQVEQTDKGYSFVPKRKDNFYHSCDLQVIYGYMQIGEIITDQERIKKYYWHPHSSDVYTCRKKNALYIPSDKLSLYPDMKGYGTFKFREDRVLTMEGMSRAKWNEYEFLMPEHVYGNKKNCAKGKGLYYAGIWQELVVNESEALLDWVKSVII
ncbi:hypothetical protein [Butyrivibrio fibrisolvens]|uniref:Nmad3 family putative nucleotide modification protein n=1 Tax=Butyrivibrio fibrisolvens TaxID=831 RepID=UPI0004225B00|nr:hypothetical protein [Butyrivibrio fibrisolvens]